MPEIVHKPFKVGVSYYGWLQLKVYLKFEMETHTAIVSSVCIVQWWTRCNHEIISSPNNNLFVLTIYFYMSSSTSNSLNFVHHRKAHKRTARSWLHLEIVWYQLSNWLCLVLKSSELCWCLWVSIPSIYAITFKA